jgi:DNA polymerase-3 subunit delta
MAKRPEKAPATKPERPAKRAGGLTADVRIAIFHGPEDFLRQQHTATLREALANAHGEVDTIVLDGSSAQAVDVLDECRSFGLIAAHKMVVVDQAEQMVKEDARPLFEKYAQGPSEGATLVLRASAWRAGNLDKMVAQVGVVMACEALSEQEAGAWVVARAGHHKAAIDARAAGNLVSRVGVSLTRLDMELSKLATAAGEGQAITTQLVAQFVGVSREEEAWNIQASLLTHGTPAALAHLRHIRDVSRQPAPLVMYAVLDLARKLHGVCAGVKAGVSPGALTRPLRLWGPSQGLVVDTARRLRPEQTLAFLNECVRMDARSKSGLTDADRGLEMLVVRLGAMLSGS